MTTRIPNDPNRLLRRKSTAEALTESGYPISEKTLATMASRTGGPPYFKFGRAVVYRWADALGWAESRLSAPRRTTSEARDGTTASVLLRNRTGVT
jgi:hypothetical protein